MNKEHFREKSCRKCTQKLIPDLFPIFVNNPKQALHAINSFKIRYFKRGYQKAFKKLTLFFLSNPVPFNWQDYKKQKGPGTSDQLHFRLHNKFRKIPLLVIYYLTSLMMLYKAGFELFKKLRLLIYARQFMTS